MLKVHILDAGLPLCRSALLGPVPGTDWPKDHHWIGRDEGDLSNCARCRVAAGLGITTKHWLEQITEIYFVVADNEEGEGVVSALFGDVWMPLMAADKSRLNNIMPVAQDVAKETGMTLKLVKFTARVMVEEIKP